MPNLYYNDRLIIAFTSLNQSDKHWTAGAEITWKRDGARQSHTIGGLTDRFKSSEDAERFVINLAKSWIDANPSFLSYTFTSGLWRGGLNFGLRRDLC